MAPPPLPVHVSGKPAGRSATTPARRRLLFVIGTLGLIVMAVVIQTQSWILPACGLKRLTGVPCPACGGTRSLAALGQGDWFRGVELNPLAALTAIAILAWGGVGLVAERFGGRGGTTLERWLGTRACWWAIAGAISVNWIYLIVVGR